MPPVSGSLGHCPTDVCSPRASRRPFRRAPPACATGASPGHGFQVWPKPLIANGLSNAEIAERLVISMPTVKTHVGSLLAKLHARDRAQLVIIAYESGLAERGMPS